MTAEFEKRLNGVENIADYQYLALLQDILDNGVPSSDRTGTGTIKVFERQLRFDLSGGLYPLLTTKKVWFPGVAKELLWFISGSRNIAPLVQQGVHIWDEWPYQKYLQENGLEGEFPKYTDRWREKMTEFATQVADKSEFAERWGDLGPVYGFLWRRWPAPGGGEVDQLKVLIEGLINNPFSRRHLVTAWNPSLLENVALPSCHHGFQCNVREQNGQRFLDLGWRQRSVDTFLGLPFNIASYGLFLLMLGQVTNYQPGELVASLGDTHLYLNHTDQVKTQLSRVPFPSPKVELNHSVSDIDDFKFEDIKLIGYQSHSPIKAPISV